MESGLGVHIDLYNLEDVKFEGSKYVLTSPRSLEACSRLDVKPIELLYKPLSEFQEELLPQDVPLRTIYALYDESEQIRQKKLTLCRDESGRMSEERKYLSTILSKDVAAKGTRKRATALSPTKSAGYKRNTEEKKTQRARSQSADRRKTQWCSSSVTKGTQVEFRSGSVPNISVRLPARDAKILNLMKQRRKGEKKKLYLSGDAHLLWDSEKKWEEALRIIAENKRRQLLTEENRIGTRKMEKLLDNKQEREQFEERKCTIKSREKCEEQAKLKRARSAHRKMEVEMEAWKHELLHHKKMLEDRASVSEVVNKSIELKSWEVRKNRINRKMEQKINISKIHKDVEKWRQDLEKSLLLRDRKVDDLLEKKERTVTWKRTMAQLSQMLRDDIKEKYESDTFDKKVVEAELYASLNNNHKSRSPSAKNRSSIKLC